MKSWYEKKQRKIRIEIMIDMCYFHLKLKFLIFSPQLVIDAMDFEDPVCVLMHNSEGNWGKKKHFRYTSKLLLQILILKLKVCELVGVGVVTVVEI